MNNISFNLSGKIDPQLVKVFGAVDKDAAQLNIPFFVLGAMARDLVLEHIFRLSAPRRTRYLDIGIEVSEWNEVKRLSDALAACLGMIWPTWQHPIPERILQFKRYCGGIP